MYGPYTNEELVGRAIEDRRNEDRFHFIEWTKKGLDACQHNWEAGTYRSALQLLVDGGVELDAADLVAVELALQRDVVDVVVLDRGEDAAEVADDAVLPAVEDRVAPHHVRADVLAVPADLQAGEHCLDLVLVALLVAAQCRVVVARRGLLAE